jgi:hypothetical protein
MTTMRQIITATLLAVLCLCGNARRAAAGDAYYVMIFGSESEPKQLRLTHTFATFIRATGEGSDPANYALTAHTISWLPRALDVRVRRLRPEPGVNLDLESTLRLVMRDGESVTMWGPYLISPLIYNRSIEVFNKLNSGSELYRAYDGPLNDEISNCIHAVADVDPRYRRTRYPLNRVGKPASAYIAKKLLQRTSFDQAALDHGWLVPRLGLQRYPIEYVGNQGPPRLPHYEIQSLFARLRTLEPGSKRSLKQ